MGIRYKTIIKLLDVPKAVLVEVYDRHQIKSVFPIPTLFPAWISNRMLSKVWDEITYPFPNFNGCTVEVWEWIINFMPHIIMYVITYPCWDQH